MKRDRRRIRQLALQALYEIDCVGHRPEEVLARQIEDQANLSQEGVEFLRNMVLGTLEYAEALDRFIADSAPEWPVDQLAIVDRTILRLALWEFAVSSETPLKVAINEAVEIAKRFGSESSPRFVNGVLGSLADREGDIRRQLQPTG
jgi:N utilization substance protein B